MTFYHHKYKGLILTHATMFGVSIFTTMSLTYNKPFELIKARNVTLRNCFKVKKRRSHLCVLFRSSKQLSNVSSSGGGCSSRSTQRRQTTSAQIMTRSVARPQGSGTLCPLVVFLFLLSQFYKHRTTHCGYLRIHIWAAVQQIGRLFLLR